MNFVRFKGKHWIYENPHQGIGVTEGGYYFFPYFINDSYTKVFKCIGDISNSWDDVFSEISKAEFMKALGIEETSLDLIIFLLESIDDKHYYIKEYPDRQNKYLALEHSSVIIAIELLKKYNYGKKALIDQNV